MAEDPITGGMMHRSAVGLALAAACILVTLVGAVGVIGLYYLLSPYQNCLRFQEGDNEVAFRRLRGQCMEITSW
tara:strand:- start:143 stop:364 length:222 start_codon:yes stop_codon:yes gene_type:complete